LRQQKNRYDKRGERFDNRTGHNIGQIMRGDGRTFARTGSVSEIVRPKVGDFDHNGYFAISRYASARWRLFVLIVAAGVPPANRLTAAASRKPSGVFSSFAPERLFACAFPRANYKSLDKDRKELDTVTRD
jgi:hypothetical protein